MDRGQEFFQDEPVFFFARLIDSPSSKTPTHRGVETHSKTSISSNSIVKNRYIYLISNYFHASLSICSKYSGAVIKMAMLARETVLNPLHYTTFILIKFTYRSTQTLHIRNTHFGFISFY